MNKPRRPALPTTPPPTLPVEPDPRQRPDERKEGGPDFGKEARQHEKADKSRNDARHGVAVDDRA